jgi:hypothetical protein
MTLGFEIPISIAIASFAWLVNKTWEIKDRKRLRHIEIVSRLSSLFDDGKKENRAELLNEISKLWIEGSVKVVRAANMLLDSIEKKGGDKDQKFKELVIAMRESSDLKEIFTAFFSKKLIPDDVKIRSAN